MQSQAEETTTAASTSTVSLMRPPRGEYDDDVLFGARREAIRLVELARLGNNSECVLFTHKTFVDLKQQWSIKNLIASDKRIKSMLEALEISHALPLQSHCWSLIHHGLFPFVCIAPEATGKTYAHLLYAVSRVISSIPLVKTEELISGTNEINASSTPKFEPVTVPDSISNGKSFGGGVNNLFSEKGLKLPKDFDFDTFDYDSLGKPPDKSSGQQELENESDPNDYIMHPHYIIVCSSQQQVEMICQEAERMKLAAYGHRASALRCKNLPPVVRSIYIRQEEEKLALKCSESNIIIATPASLNRCFKLDYLDFAKCKKVFFDDLDLTLQLHNSAVRDLIKFYLIQTQSIDNESGEEEERDYELDKQQQKTKKNSATGCQMFVFSRKWTNLVRQFVSTVFLQRTLIFGSIVEAALYANLRYELEISKDDAMRYTRLANLFNLYINGRSQGEKMVIVCESNENAKQVCSSLQKLNKNLVRFLDDEAPKKSLEAGINLTNSKCAIKPVYVMSDNAVEHVAEFLNDFTHLVHFSLPEDLLVYDQRFRLLYKNIRDMQRSLNTTLFLGYKLSSKYAKELQDQVSRSKTTLKSTRLELRDFISESASNICWRWASTGLCRLEKLSRDDHFGSYCQDKHAITTDPTGAPKIMKRWPTSGQVKLTITHLVSPNEFYFWFESHRDISSPDKKWNKLEATGSEFMKDLQIKLDKLKDTPSCSVPLKTFKKGTVYGIYLQQETRVDRIMLLEQPDVDMNVITEREGLMSKLSRIQHSLAYSKQCEVLRIDYGIKFSVYLRNIFEIPSELALLDAQCYRGFHLSYKPTDNEPNWTYKAKKQFYDNVCVNNLHEITAWLRLNSNRCFWFDNMVVSRKLPNIDADRLYSSEPHKELLRVGLAERVVTEPSCLNPSDRLETLSKWHVNASNEFAQYAFLRRDKDPLDIYILHTYNNLELSVRQKEFNKNLIELEDRMLKDYHDKKLISLSYLAVGVYCVTRIVDSYDAATKKPIYTINRCIIRALISDPSPSSSSTASTSSTAKTSPAVNQDLTSKQVRSMDNLFKCEYLIECLDHGDKFRVKRADLFLASPDYLTQLPFQAIKCNLADLNRDLCLDDKVLCRQIQEFIYGMSRKNTEQLIEMKCRFGIANSIYVYAPVVNEPQLYDPLISLLEQKIPGVQLWVNNDAELRKPIRWSKAATEAIGAIREQAYGVNKLIYDVLRAMVKQELSARGVSVDDDSDDEDYDDDENCDGSFNYEELIERLND